jgi:hypothetical protein
MVSSVLTNWLGNGVGEQGRFMQYAAAFPKPRILNKRYYGVMGYVEICAIGVMHFMHAMHASVPHRRWAFEMSQLP